MSLVSLVLLALGLSRILALEWVAEHGVFVTKKGGGKGVDISLGLPPGHPWMRDGPGHQRHRVTHCHALPSTRISALGVPTSQRAMPDWPLHVD